MKQRQSLVKPVIMLNREKRLGLYNKKIANIFNITKT